MSNHLLKIHSACIAMLLVGCGLLFWRVQVLEQQLQNRDVVLEQLTLVDSEGAVRIKLQAGGGDIPALLAMFDAQRRMRWLMATDSQGRSGLSMIADDSPRWSMSLAEEGTAYEMRDAIKPMIAEWPGMAAPESTEPTPAMPSQEPSGP